MDSRIQVQLEEDGAAELDGDKCSVDSYVRLGVTRLI